MTHPSITCLAAHVSLALSLAVSSNVVHAQSINNRKTSARATIAGSRNLYDGTFVATGVSSICGETPKEMSFNGTATFMIEYPSDAKATDQIQSISFGSNKLVEGVTKASLFTLNVGVLAKNGGRPYAYVLNTDPVTAKNTGTATLRKNKGGSVTLSVVGKNDMGQAIQLTVTCM